MGGTLFACGPDYDPENHDWDDIVHVGYRYSGFIELKAILIRATIAFLTALSAAQISKDVLVEKGVADADAVEGVDEAIVIANYRSRIDKAIPLLQGWLRTPGPSPVDTNPLASLFASLGPTRSDQHAGTFSIHQQMMDFMANIPLDFDAIDKARGAHVLAELNLSGIQIFAKMQDTDGIVAYPQTQEVAKAFRMVRSHCEWKPPAWTPKDGDEYLGEFIDVFEAAPAGGKVCT